MMDVAVPTKDPSPGSSSGSSREMVVVVQVVEDSRDVGE